MFAETVVLSLLVVTIVLSAATEQLEDNIISIIDNAATKVKEDNKIFGEVEAIVRPQQRDEDLTYYKETPTFTGYYSFR